jgi:arsenate reductase
MLPIIQRYILEAIKGFDTIPEERKRALHQIISYVQKKSDANHTPELLYICMRNSRMSHFGQIWGSVAATYYGFPHVKTYSGGIQATVFDLGSIRIIETIGFIVKQTDNTPNPLYTIQFGDSDIHITCFSKKYDANENPAQGFCVIMMCREAEAALTHIDGAEVWVSTLYNEFKPSDSTADLDDRYLESIKEIATECLYVFSRLSQ